MTPDEMSELLAAWAHNVYPYDRRVTCLEPEGPRRTWVLYEGGRQVGHARMRASAVKHNADGEMCWYSGPWTVEASDRTRTMLKLDDAPESGQTDPHG